VNLNQWHSFITYRSFCQIPDGVKVCLSEDWLEKKNGGKCGNKIDFVKELVIDNGSISKDRCDVKICNYPNLEKITIKNTDLVNIQSLYIGNNKKN